jgi:hypothetical protein
MQERGSHVTGGLGEVGAGPAEFEGGDGGGGVDGWQLGIENRRGGLSAEADGPHRSEEDIASGGVTCHTPEDVT